MFRLIRSSPSLRQGLAVLLACAVAGSAQALTVSVDDSRPWVGYVNLYEPPPGDGFDRGARVDGFYLDTDIGSLPGRVDAGVATLSPNALFGGAPTEGNPDWWTPDGSGGFTANRVIEANLYVDLGLAGADLAGDTLRFVGTTMSDTLAAPYAAYAWIRKWEPGYVSLVDEVIVALAPGQGFDLALPTTAGLALQYGFVLVGPNADPAALVSLGSVSVSAVPEVATPAMWMLGALALAAAVRRRNGARAAS